MIRVMTLANGQQVTLGQYARAWRMCKAAAPGTEFKHGVSAWWPQTREDILRDFMRNLHLRINQQVPYVKRGMGGTR